MTSLQTNTTLAKNRMQNSFGSAVFLAFFLLFVPLLLVGCGGGGGTVTTAPTTPTTKVTLSGTAFDAAIVGGTVTVLDSNGSILGTTTTDANGQFSLDVPEDKLSGGYRLSVSGGTMDGAAFTGTLTATYAAKDSKNTVNLTPITTLLDRLTEGKAGGTFLEKRDAAIQQLVGLGMVKADDWFALTSDRFDLNMLAARIGAKGGLQAWLDALVADVADGELSIEEMAAFPKTNGGIVSAGLQGATDGVFSVFIGDTLQSKITVAGQDGASYQYQAITVPDGLTVGSDGAIAYPVPEGTPENQSIPLTFNVTNTATALGRTVSASIYPMKRNVSGGETVTPGTGTKEITTAAGDTSVKISTDGMTTPGKVEIIQSLNAEGNPQTTYSFDKNVKGTVEITLPDSAAPSSDAFSTSVVQPQVQATPQAKAEPQARAVPQAKAPSAYEELLKYVWMSRKANFLKTSCGSGVGNRVSDAIVSVDMDRCTVYPRQVTIDAVREDSFTLTSECLVGDRACLSGKTPVLFVHGFLPSTKLGGGEGTWKYFPQAIKNRISDARVFEFQWRTSARFEDAAGDLALAVKLIAEETGQKVHIIAHSFGGVLTRTYLQGLATGMPYNNDVASVTTVGSPHSGIFDTAKKAHGVSFPQGQDKNYGANLSGNQNVNFCQQTSCYQMGESVDFSKVERLLFGVEVTGLSPSDMPGKFMAGLSDMQTHPLPAGLPIQVLIGLTTSMYDNHVVDTGDGLISFDGQRISPTLDISQAYRNQTTQFGGVVTEKLLGLEPSLYPGDKYPGTSTGYRHSDWTIFPSDAVPEVQVSESCDGNPDCANEHQHLAFLNAKNWIIAVGNQPYNGSSGKFTLKPFIDIPATGQLAVLALNPSTTASLTAEQRTYLESLVAKANNNKLVQGGTAHWDKLDKVEADTIASKSLQLFGNNSASAALREERKDWLNSYWNNETLKRFKDTNPFPWVTKEGWLATADIVINDAKGLVGAAKVAYSFTPGVSAATTNLDALPELKTKLASVEIAAKALGCTEFAKALADVAFAPDDFSKWTNVPVTAGSCVTGFVESERWKALSASSGVAQSIQDRKNLTAIVDFTNLLVGSWQPQTPLTTALSGVLDVVSATLNVININAEYADTATKNMLLAQSDAEAGIKQIEDAQFKWYSSRLINARLEGYFITKYVVADFTITPDIPTVGVEVKFVATASSTKGDIISYAWDFGDGVTDAPIGLPKATTYHTYKKAGTYTVKLTVMDGALPVVVEKRITVGEALDEDGDRLPDWWEAEYGVSDPDADDDGDGLNNLGEYNAGTIPKGEGAEDTDGDGFNDKEEVDAGTSPTDPKTWPLKLTARADDEQVTLIWNHAPEGTPAVAYYSACYALTDIYPRTVTDNVVTDQASCQQKEGGVWIPSINEATYQVSNLDMAKTYHFMVLGMDSDGKEVRRSNEAIAQPLNPATPKNVTATAVLQKKVRLTWSAVEGSTGYAYCYSFLRDDCAVYKETSWIPTQEVSVLIEDLRNVPHYFRVVSFDKDGKASSVSKEASATPAFTAPAVTPASGNAKVTLLWLSSDDPTDSYAYCYSTVADDCKVYGEGNWTYISGEAGKTISIPVTGLTNDVPYYFNVVIKDASGNIGMGSINNGVFTATPTASIATGVTSCPKPVKSILFKESFDGTEIDRTKWDVDYTGGNAFIADGKLSVTSDGTDRFPVVQTKTNPFPASGNFSFYCKANYTQIAQNGTGACVAVQKMIANGSASSTYDSGSTLQLWADSSLGGVSWWGGEWLGTAGGTQLFGNIVPQDTADHEYEACVIGSQVIGYRDGVKVGEGVLPSGWQYPTKIWIGNPVTGSAGYPWSTFDTDAVEVRQLEDGIDPTGWIQNPTTGHYYKALNNCGNWEQCETAAQALRAHLVVIEDQAENDWLASTFIVPLDSWGYWIGYTDKEQEGVWKTVTGITVTGDVYTNWDRSPDQPDNYGGNQNYAVSHTNMRYGNQWNDIGFDDSINRPAAPTYGVIERTTAPNINVTPNPFTVQATDEVGTAFTVPAGKTQCMFNAMGTWKWAVDSSAVSAAGAYNISDSVMPSSTLAALIMQHPDKTYELIGQSATKLVVGGDTLRFLFNDRTGAYTDNSGALSVSWSCQ